MWKINRFPDGKVMISVTGDELLGILPPEVDELIEDHNDTCTTDEQKINIEPYFTEKSVYTFNISPNKVVLNDRNEELIMQ